MRSTPITKSLYVIALLALLFVQTLPARATLTVDEAAATLPDAVGDFRAQGKAAMPTVGLFEKYKEEDFAAYSHAARAYVSTNGEKFAVDVIKTRSSSGAYAILTHKRKIAPAQTVKLEGIGTYAIAAPGGISFFKGPVFVNIYSLGKQPGNSEAAVALARLFAQSLENVESDIPVLVKHLPEWETAHERADYAVSLKALQEASGNRPVLDAVSFDGGAEAVAVSYGASRLVIVENTTPQLATTNDTRINARLNELRASGQPLPSAYRRVGNYSVFVFDAPNEQEAGQLIDKISYEQVVQWLGTNPYALQRAQREYSETTAGVILAVVQASGLSLLICLGIGAIFGTIVFRRRRAQQAATDAYSDAGGMLRLNIDEMTPQTDPARLIGRGDR